MADKSGEKVPVLTDRQVLVLNSIMQQLLFNPESAATFLVNPRPPLISMGMSEDDVNNIVGYFQYVREVVEKDHGDDW